jgi:hypothetical protein
MAETKSYSVTCPDPDCAAEFELTQTPEQLADGAECFACPECGELWEWSYDELTDTLTLLADYEAELDEDEDDEDEDDDDDEDDEDDEEEEDDGTM